MKRFLMAVAIAAVLAACGQGGFQRGVFHGKVIDRTPEDVVSSFGKPDAIESGSEGPRYVYLKKTFNPDNQNQVVDKTIVEFGKDKDGKIVRVDVSYM
jgi:ABC-type glycerol-3-phosphate transport system substrate-binding protein